MSDTGYREGALDAPERHALDWKSKEFFDEASLLTEMERVFDICHGCRRCFNLCHAFPTLFDAVDESESGELDTVSKEAYWDVVDHCYLCDMCFMSKCPYVPPHEWNVDFPHLMLRAKAVRFRQQGASLPDRVLANTDAVGSLAGIPVVAQAVNTVNASGPGRALLKAALGVSTRAPVPRYESRPARARLADRVGPREIQSKAVNGTQGKVVLFTTCYGNRNAPSMVEDLVAVFEHNDIRVALPETERCCGMPRLELGDLDAVAAARDANVPELAQWARDGWDIVSLVPSCVLMFSQELPLLFPDDDAVATVAGSIYDPFNYLWLRHKGDALNTGFTEGLGKVAYQVPCHLRVQNIGLKTRDVLQLVPGSEVSVVERCSGHDGTYGVKARFRDPSEKIARTAAGQVARAGAAYFATDCPMAGEQLKSVNSELPEYLHPMSLLRKAYGI